MGRGRWNGYRLAPGTDLFDFTDRLRAEIGPVRDRLDAAMLMGSAIRKIDVADAHGQPRHFAPLFQAMTDYDDAQAKAAECGRDSRAFDPHRFEVTFARDPDTGRILALLYCEQPALIRAWRALAEVEDYHHQSFADRPDDVDEEEWDARHDAWQRVLPDLASPAERMLMFTLRSEPPHDTGLIYLTTARSQDRDEPAEAARRALLAEAAPSRRERATSLAVNLLCQEWVRRRTEATGSEPTPSETMRFIRRCARLPLEDTQPCEQVIAALEAALNDDVVPYAIDGQDLTDTSAAEIRTLLDATDGSDSDVASPYTLDLTTTHTAITGWLDTDAREPAGRE